MEIITYKNYKIRVRDNKYNGNDLCKIFGMSTKHTNIYFKKEYAIFSLKGLDVNDEDLFIFLDEHSNGLL